MSDINSVQTAIATEQSAPDGVASDEKKRGAVRKTAAADRSNEKIAAAKKKQAFVYLGPNVPGGILFTGSVYKEIPEHLKDVFEKVPEIKELFVEIKGVPAFKAEIERQGSEAFRIRQNVERLISETS